MKGGKREKNQKCNLLINHLQSKKLPKKRLKRMNLQKERLQRNNLNQNSNSLLHKKYPLKRKRNKRLKKK
jgi:hypothetical protein